MEAVKETTTTEGRVLFLQPVNRVENAQDSLVVQVAIAGISSSPYQTRQFDEGNDLSEMVASVKNHGILQPILLRETETGGYELVAGERRLRAAQLAGLETIPAIVSKLSDQDAVEISIIENAQRENLNPIEEAKAFAILSKRFSLSQSDIAQAIGKHRAVISNSLRLLQLDAEVQDFLAAGQLSAGHGRLLLSLESSQLQRRLARRAARSSMSVRKLEELITRLNEKAGKKRKANSLLRPQMKETSKLQEILGMEHVSVKSSTSGARQVTLRFDDEKKWKQFVSRLRKR